MILSGKEFRFINSGELFAISSNSKPNSNNSDWDCEDGYFETGDICTQCSPCPDGEERTGCSGTSGGSCSPCTGQTYKSNGVCTNVPSNSSPTANKGDFTCNEGYFKSGNSCSQCGGCTINKYRSGCTPTSAGNCSNCPYGRVKDNTGNGGISSCIPCGNGRMAMNTHGSYPRGYCMCPPYHAYADRPGMGQWCRKKWPDWPPGPEWAV